MAADFPLKVVIGAVDRAMAPLRAMHRRIQALTAPVRSLNARFRSLGREMGLDRVSHRLAIVRTRLVAVGSAAKMAAMRLAGIGLAAVGAGYSVARLLDRVSSGGDETIKFARQVGWSATALQEYEFAGERAGVSTNLLRKAIEQSTKRVGELRSGSGALLSYLKRTDAGLLAQVRSAGSSERAFDLLVESLGRETNAAKRAALANAAFGRGGMALVRIVDQGADETARLRQEAHRLGYVMSDEALEASEAYNDAIWDLKAAAGGLGKTIGAELMPHVTDLAVRTADWFKTSRAQIEPFVARLGDLVPTFDQVVAAATRLRDAGSRLRDVFGEIRDRIRPLSDLAGGDLNLALIGLAAVVGGKLIVAVYSLATAMAALGVASLPVTGAVLVIGASLVAVGVAIAELRKSLPALGLLFRGVMLKIQSDTGAALVWIAEKVAALLKLFSFVPGTRDLSARAQEAIDAIKGRMPARADSSGDFVTDAMVSAMEHRGADRARLNRGALATMQTYPATKERLTRIASEIARSARPDAPSTPEPSRGEVTVRFEGAPRGTRVESAVESGPLVLRTDLGFALAEAS